MAEVAGGTREGTSDGLDLIAFARYLEGQGYTIDADRCAAAQAILAWQALDLGLRGNAARLAGYLSPLFARTPEEQQAFPEHLSRWLAPAPESTSETAPSVQTAASASGARSTSVTRGRRPWAWACVLALAIASIAAAGAWWDWRVSLSGKVVDPEGTAVAGATVELPRSTTKTDASGAFSFALRRWELPATLRVMADGYQAFRSPVGRGQREPITVRLQTAAPVLPAPPPKSAPAVSFVKGLIPSAQMVYSHDPLRNSPVSFYNPWAVRIFGFALLLAAGLWLIWRLLPGYVARVRYRGRPKITRIRVGKGSEGIFAHPRFRHVMQLLSRHRPEPSRELDLAATVRNTIYNAGRFTPAFGNWLVRPEYLALIERVSEGDQRARLATELLGEWEKNGVFVRQQYFYGDPTVSRPQDAPGKTYSLGELGGRFADHILLVFSEAKGFVHPYTGKPAQWVSQMSEWPLRVMFLPEPVDSFRAGVLGAAGFRICTDTREGIAQFAESVLAGNSADHPVAAESDEFPEVLGEAPSQWLDRRPPDPRQVARLSIQLRAYLGEEGYLILAACAAYPELSWNITLFLMEQLIAPQRVELVANRLLRLPWFRHGYLPDWLRRRLLEHLSPEDDGRVRDALERLLYSYLAKPRKAFLLEVATQRLRAWQRSLLRQIVFLAPAGDSLRERVFLRFLSGVRGPRLNLRLPRAVRTWLDRHELRLEHRGWIAAGAVVAIASAALGIAAVVPAFQQTEPLNAGAWVNGPPDGWDRSFSRLPSLANISVALTAPQVAYLYNFPSEYDGAGQTIGLVELGGGYRDADLDEYFKSLQLPRPQVSWVSANGGKNSPGDITGPDGEVMMGLEIAGGIAPKAHLVAYFAPNTKGLDGITLAVQTALADKQNHPSVILIGWGGPELDYTAAARAQMEAIFQNAARQNVTIVVASGDGGAADGTNAVTDKSKAKLAVDYPASSPWVLGVGGTALTATATGVIDTEVVWSDFAFGGATGGGVSEVFPMPEWQSRVNVPMGPYKRKGRGVPDVAASASPETGYQLIVDGHAIVIGGSGAAASVWAGLIALMNQALGRNLGFINPLLYSRIGPAGVLRSIIKGNNSYNGVKGYQAGPGWNPCTGWGSPDGRKLLAALSTAVH